MELVRDITKSFERNEHVLGVLIDFKKAFDTKNHNILLRKLKPYGINGTCYLSNRNQCSVYEVYDNITKSRYYMISY